MAERPEVGKHDFRMIRSYLEEKGIVHWTFQRNYNPQVSCFPELFEIGNCLLNEMVHFIGHF